MSTPSGPSRVGLVVAVDGTSGSGKSSTSRGVAARLGLRYLDTGAMFRAVTWAMLEAGVDVHDAAAVAARVDGEDVSVAIRADRVNAAVSPVAVVPAVRTLLLELQREVIRRETVDGGIVVEGRDIGSVVWPDARVKLYVTADPAARAARRAAEEGGSDVAATEASLLARDVIDSGRATAPLVMADGAVHLDTTPYTLDEVIDRVVALVDGAA